ncbi:hypothetical protein SAMN05443245_5612 [Paraburkholderia fungorum]|uniref:Uncharacterized protein n=1 Tax=Paraburkholderia fungorum TaxID=134537 RepID=A0A1H1ITU0_9BURK|nr:hypothetical protein [Paraburkholderia fungorum]SDR40766.1 hypothetical protein SAMN05443245_5612 [Paraburkholderia fungorum]
MKKTEKPNGYAFDTGTTMHVEQYARIAHFELMRIGVIAQFQKY